MNRTNTFDVTNNIVLAHFDCGYEIINEHILEFIELNQVVNGLQQKEYGNKPQ
jgi:hypothetical protein